MPCYKPIPARRGENGAPWTLHPELGTQDATIPCGKCLGCRTDTQNAWVQRCTHEASIWKENRFVTLTYDDEHLPPELIPKHLTDFLKRLRWQRGTDDNILSDRSASIRYLACGEYGERTARPHYHLCLFNCGFHDEEQYSQKLKTSETLTDIWSYGAAKLAPFTPATAGYVAGYITKHGRRTYYSPPDSDGVVTERYPPFKRQSTRPALGRSWLEKHHADLQHGYLVHEGIRTRIPRYYGTWLLQNKETRQKHSDLKARPTPKSDKKDEARLKAAEIIHEQNQRRKIRQLE